MKAAFYKGKRRLFNRLVSWWDRGPYSHMEIVFDDQTAASSSFMDSGVRFKSIKFDDSRWDFIELPRELFAEDISRDWFYNHLGLRYDFFGLIRFAIDAIPERKGKYFCSEACLASLGVNEAWRFTPNSAYSFLSTLVKLKAKNV
jgi:hypothetical protein